MTDISQSNKQGELSCVPTRVLCSGVQKHEAQIPRVFPSVFLSGCTAPTRASWRITTAKRNSGCAACCLPAAAPSLFEFSLPNRCSWAMVFMWAGQSRAPSDPNIKCVCEWGEAGYTRTLATPLHPVERMQLGSCQCQMRRLVGGRVVPVPAREYLFAFGECYAPLRRALAHIGQVLRAGVVWCWTYRSARAF